jgi:hypothetical protein
VEAASAEAVRPAPPQTGGPQFAPAGTPQG